MTGREIEIGTAGQRRRIASRQSLQIERVAGQQSMSQQGWQRKIINYMRFILITEIGQILVIGNVGLGYDDQRFGMMVHQGAQKPNYLVGFIQID